MDVKEIIARRVVSDSRTRLIQSNHKPLVESSKYKWDNRVG